ncbi:response regulator transcription factor [Polaribacter sp. M15]
MTKNQGKERILIVEDEVLLAMQVKKNLLENGYSDVIITTNYKDAVRNFKKYPIDIALLDININGAKSGIDIANFINENIQIPFIFLTSYNDEKTLEKLMLLKPLAYLNKPINKYTLLSAINFYFKTIKKAVSNIVAITIGSKIYQINKSEIVFVQAENVYLNIHHLKQQKQLIRFPLSKFLSHFSSKELIQINRSTAINLKYVQEFSFSQVKIQEQYFKISKKFSDDFKTQINPNT